jgi:hypothetical protein
MENKTVYVVIKGGVVYYISTEMEDVRAIVIDLDTDDFEEAYLDKADNCTRIW